MSIDELFKNGYTIIPSLIDKQSLIIRYFQTGI